MDDGAEFALTLQLDLDFPFINCEELCLNMDDESVNSQLHITHNM